MDFKCGQFERKVAARQALCLMFSNPVFSCLLHSLFNNGLVNIDIFCISQVFKSEETKHNVFSPAARCFASNLRFHVCSICILYFVFCICMSL